MLEITVLRDVVAAYGTLWVPISNSHGIDQIKIGDEFRENGTGEAGEIVAVEALDLSPVPGASRLYFRRGEHATRVETHRLGAVFTRLEKEPVAVAGKRAPKREANSDLLGEL
jgi:hypothetical protein